MADERGGFECRYASRYADDDFFAHCLLSMGNFSKPDALKNVFKN